MQGYPSLVQGAGLRSAWRHVSVNRILAIAKVNKDVAAAIIVQAIIDEGAIGADGSITITYTSKENAMYLWEIAHAWDFVHPLRKKEYSNHTKWCVSFRADKRKELYELVGPLPDPRHDKMFRHILRNHHGGPHKNGRGESERMVLDVLRKKPTTVRQIAYDLDLSASSVRKHLRTLRKNKKVIVSGCDKKAIHKNQRTAEIWTYCNALALRDPVA
jgi:DNA-binding transcriptional ArsR family regulator